VLDGSVVATADVPKARRILTFPLFEMKHKVCLEALCVTGRNCNSYKRIR
jgi:hypothetical protein